MKNLFFILFIFQSLKVAGHDKLVLSGQLIDEKGQSMVGGHIFLSDFITVSDLDGRFVFKDLEPGKYSLTCHHIGYHSYHNSIDLTKDTVLVVKLVPDILNLNEVVINDNKMGDFKTLNTQRVEATAIMDKYAGSFIKSIESMPGVNAMDIGASMSKPVIRGLGFNRIVIAENGIKQEGQQWGADHGLEIDPFNVEKASVIKGAASIEYGSDAIGGVINIENTKVPERNSLGGEVSLLAKSVNQTIGGSMFAQYRGERYYFKIRGTLLDYGDYTVPTDKINYLNTLIPIYNNRLKNTAGIEKDFYVVGGYLSDRFRSSLIISHVNQQNGFFPGSHGIPSIERVQDDGNRRNVEYPYQHATHLKGISNSVWILGNHDLHLDMGYQENKRQEWSRFHTHFSGQAPPEINPDLELDFKLRTFSINAKYHFHIAGHNFTVGTQNQFQDNAIGGYNYFLPVFSRKTSGIFLKDDLEVNNRLNLTLGIRYDGGTNRNEGFYDSLLYRDLLNRGFDEYEANFYANRSISSAKSAGNVSWLAGIAYQINEKWTSRFNIGKSFRMPLAIELGANGIHHGSFRHEIGDPSLDSEVGYYVDGAIESGSNHHSLSVNPYIYYFSNYIFLNPSRWSYLAHAGQIYEYTQSKAMLAGLEISFSKSLGQRINITGNLEYIHNRQLSGESKSYAMPFTPPVNGFGELEYDLVPSAKSGNHVSVFLNSRFALRQNQLAKNESSTPGYHIYGLGAKTIFNISGRELDVSLQVQNVFNTKYFSHISFYRKLEIPEPGRNIQLLVKVPFNK